MKGILFKPDMIKAIVEGHKTMTRRVIKPQPSEWATKIAILENGFCYEDTPAGRKRIILKPRYQVGEVVYIKEAYWQDQSGGVWCYKAGGLGRGLEGALEPDYPPRNCGGKAVSPLFMPAWAARYHIRIISVRAERLQEITEEDAKAEGIITPKQKCSWHSWVWAFKDLWNLINGKSHPWASNPWVWVYSFEEVRDGCSSNSP